MQKILMLKTRGDAENPRIYNKIVFYDLQHPVYINSPIMRETYQVEELKSIKEFISPSCALSAGWKLLSAPSTPVIQGRDWVTTWWLEKQIDN